jgi:hypothetical protein
MKKIALTVAVLALGLAACGGKSGKSDQNVVVVDETESRNVDECPRADGQPCA